MSWVEELKASRKKMARVAWKKKLMGITKAIPASPQPIRNCMVTIHQRFVLKISTKGDHNGFITHGSPKSPVQKVMAAFDMPILAYITTESIITAA